MRAGRKTSISDNQLNLIQGGDQRFQLQATVKRKSVLLAGFSDSMKHMSLALALSFSMSPKIDPNSTTKK
jgi:hypothetical protein